MAKIDHISYGGTSYEIAPAAGDLRDVVAPEFSDQSTYTAGQMVLKNGVLYRFTADHTGAWTGSDAEVVTVGREVSDLKSVLNDLDEFCRKEIINVKTGSGTATAGNSIASQTHLIDANIANGSSYKITVDSSGCFSTFHLYTNGNPIKYNCASGTEYELVAGTNITWFSIYVSGANVTGSGTFAAMVSTSKETSNSLEKRIDNLNSNITDVSDDLYKTEYLLEPNVVFFKPLYEVGANVNNDGNAMYIYHQITFAYDGKSMIGVQCDKIENYTSNKPIMVYQNDGSTVIKTDYFSEEDAIAGIKVIPLANTAEITVGLYPSSTGGLTTTTAKYHNITVFTSNDGSYSIKDKCVPDKYAVPFYYIKNSYLQDKVDTIESLMKDANGNYDAFIFCTDQHWTLNAKQSPNLMNYIYQRLNVPRMFMGGDYADGINLNALKAYRDAFSGKIYDVIGNHEYMNYLARLGYSRASYNITEGDIYAYINMHMTDAESGNLGRGYYYVDNKMQKMRYIVLSVYADNDNSAVAQFETAQKMWLQNDALNLPNGYTAVIFAHFLYAIDYDTGVITKASTTDEILSVVDAYSGNGEIACMIAGHTHVDGMTTTPGGIPVFFTTCDKCKPWISNGTDMEPWITENRIEGTITEQAFDVVVINKTSKLISFVRIGAPADNGTGTKLEIRQQNYGT